MKIDLNAKIALVCASTKGLGFACAKGLVESGCSVILTGRSDENLRKAKEKLMLISETKSFDNKIHTIKVDLNVRSELNNFLNTLSSHSSIDILIMNSGGPAPGDFESFTDMNDFEDKTSQITYPAISLINHVLPSMKNNKWGRIINISSIGLSKPITGLAVSNASRAYLAGLMTGIANENAQHGITLNTILPGIIWTDRQKMLTQNEAENLNINLDEMIEKKSSTIPAGTMGHPDDVGYLATYLASEYAGYINGQLISVDGGLLGLLK